MRSTGWWPASVRTGRRPARGLARRSARRSAVLGWPCRAGVDEKHLIRQRPRHGRGDRAAGAGGCADRSRRHAPADLGAPLGLARTRLFPGLFKPDGHNHRRHIPAENDVVPDGGSRWVDHAVLLQLGAVRARHRGVGEVGVDHRPADGIPGPAPDIRPASRVEAHGQQLFVGHAGLLSADRSSPLRRPAFTGGVGGGIGGAAGTTPAPAQRAAPGAACLNSFLRSSMVQSFSKRIRNKIHHHRMIREG